MTKGEAIEDLVKRVFQEASLLGDELSSNFIVDCINNYYFYFEELKDVGDQIKLWDSVAENDKIFFVKEILAKFERIGAISSRKRKGKTMVEVYKRNVGKSFSEKIK